MATSAEQKLLTKLPPAAVSFFAVFSRFECALKRSGYLPPGGLAEANWDAFANDLGKVFFEEVRGSGNADTLIGAPPKKQVVVDGQLTWKATGKVTNVQELFGAVRRVRNNLFHGGKYSTGVESDTSRDQQLLEEARWVLGRALESSENVRLFFEEPLG